MKRGYSKENPALGAEIAKEIDKPPAFSPWTKRNAFSILRS